MLRLQATGRIHEEQVGSPRTSSTNGIEHDRRRVCVVAGVRNNRNIAALSPDLNLLHCSGAKRIRCSNQSRISTPHREVGQLAEGRGLAHPIHTNHQPDVELIPFRGQHLGTTGFNRGIQQTAKLLLEEADAFSGIHNLNVHPLPQGIKHLIGGLNAGIGPKQQCFEIIQDLGSERIVAQVVQQTADKSLAGFLQTTAESTQPIDLLQ